MATTKTKPISINDQVVSVTQQAAKLRNSLDQGHVAAIDGLNQTSQTLKDSVLSGQDYIDILEHCSAARAVACSARSDYVTHVLEHRCLITPYDLSW